MHKTSKDLIDDIFFSEGIIPEIFKHPPVLTCEEADKFTPEPQYGLKTLLLKSKKKGPFCTILEGNGRLDMDALKTLLDDKKISFIDSNTAVSMIGCHPGSIPPFGHMNIIPIYVASIIQTFPSVYFNPGINTCTYKISGDSFHHIITKLGGQYL